MSINSSNFTTFINPVSNDHATNLDQLIEAFKDIGKNNLKIYKTVEELMNDLEADYEDEISNQNDLIQNSLQI